MISFLFLYGFWETKYLNKIGKIYFSQEGGGMFDNGNVNWCMLGRAFLRQTGHFLVEPGIFVSNDAFYCRTGFFVSNESYKDNQYPCNRLCIQSSWQMGRDGYITYEHICTHIWCWKNMNQTLRVKTA